MFCDVNRKRIVEISYSLLFWLIISTPLVVLVNQKVVVAVKQPAFRGQKLLHVLLNKNYYI